MFKFNIFLITILVLTSCVESSKKTESKGEYVKGDEILTPIKIELFSEQFKWTARYSGEDNLLGRFDYKLTSETNPLAIITKSSLDFAENDISNQVRIKTYELENDINISEEAKADLTRLEKILRLVKQMITRHDPVYDEQALDDFLELDTLILLKGYEHEFVFRSKDVIHSAYFPHFRAQMNTVPGMTTRFKFTPDKSTSEIRKIKKDPKFNFVLLCNKICGREHYKMKMPVKVLELEEYKDWIVSKNKDELRFVSCFN